MKYLRSVLAYLWIVIIMVVGLPYRWWCNKLKAKDEAQGYAKLHKLVRVFCRGILFLGGVKLTVKGEENIPADGNVLFVGNHQSMLDIVAILAAVDKPLGFVAKDNLAKVWLIRTWIESIGSVFIARGENRKALEAVISSAKIVKSGHRMMVYPEGTRTKDGSLGEFKAGSLKIASRGEAAIVPVAINGNYRALPSGSIWVTPAQVELSFLAPISAEEVKNTDTKLLAEEIKERISYYV